MSIKNFNFNLTDFPQQFDEISFLKFVNFNKFKVGLPLKEEILNAPNALENSPTSVHFTMTFRNPDSLKVTKREIKQFLKS